MTTAGSETARLREWAVALVLASVAFWHQAIPGLDAVATLALTAVLGMWVRNRLPTAEQVSAALRRLVDWDRP